MLVSELWAWATSAVNFHKACTCLMLDTVFPPEPMAKDIAGLYQALPDVFSPGAIVLMQHGTFALYPVFVNNTGNANTQSKICNTVTALVLVAYLLIGFLAGDVWGTHPLCIYAQKWTTHLRHHY